MSERTQANKELIQRREELVDRIRRELRGLVRESGLTQRQVEEVNGFTPRYLSQVLQGHITLTVRHLCGFLLAMDMSPEEFFARLSGRTAPRYEELRERLARYDKAIEQLEEQGIVRLEKPRYL